MVAVAGLPEAGGCFRGNIGGERLEESIPVLGHEPEQDSVHHSQQRSVEVVQAQFVFCEAVPELGVGRVRDEPRSEVPGGSRTPTQVG